MISNLHDKSAVFSFETLLFRLRIRSLMVLPPYKGAVFRGALDNALRRVICPLPRDDCIHCDIHERCLYTALFHPSPPADFTDSDKFTTAPPPYVLKPPADRRQVLHPTDTLNFGLTLIGHALDALPYFIFAVDRIGRRGLGRERGGYEIRRAGLQRNGHELVVYDGHDQTLRSLPAGTPDHFYQPQSATSLVLELQTPLRIKRNGKLVTRLDFVTLYNSLSQRLSLLSAFYGKNGEFDFSELQARAHQIETVWDKTFWYDWPRYSTRQKEHMKLGGLRGRIAFEGDLTPFIPWLRLGEHVNVGQGTTFGLGGYQIVKDLSKSHL